MIGYNSNSGRIPREITVGRLDKVCFDLSMQILRHPIGQGAEGKIELLLPEDISKSREAQSILIESYSRGEYSASIITKGNENYIVITRIHPATLDLEPCVR